MTGVPSVGFFEWQESRADRRLVRLFDAAFGVEKYTLSFPHIFASQSAARIFVACDSNNALVAACAVDSEIWSFPRYLRGACIGSVAVDPAHQRQGHGRALLGWVLDQLHQGNAHDFAYLFSDQSGFYQSLGFLNAGIEKLFMPLRGNFTSTIDPRFLRPMRTVDMSASDKNRLWKALERFRKPCESHASLAKLEMVLTIPEMLFFGLENSAGEWVAGAFVGKGVDFRGVIHSFFASDNANLRDLWRQFMIFAGDKALELQVAPGAWISELADELSENHQQNLCMVLPFSNTAHDVCELVDRGELYPRSLFSS
jgi:predicted N-acetyltransferase YhbS